MSVLAWHRGPFIAKLTLSDHTGFALVNQHCKNLEAAISEVIACALFEPSPGVDTEGIPRQLLIRSKTWRSRKSSLTKLPPKKTATAQSSSTQPWSVVTRVSGP